MFTVFNLLREGKSPRQGNRRRPFRLLLESLESRLLLATFNVNSTVDLPDFNPGDGICSTAATGGVCTLRAAVQEANALANTDSTGDGVADPDIINVPAGIYTLTIPGAGEDASATGDLDISSSLVLRGATAPTTIIQMGIADAGGSGTAGTAEAEATGLDRVMHILGNANVDVANVTLRNGKAPGVGLGGGILNEAALSLTDVIVTGNEADKGGGIYHVAQAPLTITRTTVSLNVANKGGGLLNNSNVVNIVESTFSGNVARLQGGGIINTGTTMSIVRSTISGNDAGTNGGGGIFNRVPLTIINSTISGNTADGDGGGISNTGGGQVDLLNVTITGNIADHDDNDTGDGGGLLDQTEGQDRALNTIFAGNVDRSGQAPDISGPLDSHGFNLIQSTAGAFIFGDTASNILGVSPQLGPLANNGGLTLTHLPLANSPAIDAGTANLAPATDQRGVARPQPTGGQIDIGAVEVAQEAPPPVEPLVCEVTTLNLPGNPSTAIIANDADPIGGNVFIITGTSGDDAIVIEPRPSNLAQIRVKRNGQLLGIVDSWIVRHIVVFGLDGNDSLFVNPAITQPVTSLGGAGNDVVYGALGNDQLDGGDGIDVVIGGPGNDVLCGGTGNDVLYGQDGDDLVGGDAGNDVVFGDNGHDRLLGGDGDDVLYGGFGNDQIFAQAGNDVAFGDFGFDILVGGDGRDFLFGGPDNDLLIGGQGADLLSDVNEDLLIAGATLYDEDPAALAAIAAEANSANDLPTRAQHLITGGGLNGDAVLNSTTVSPADPFDTLLGLPGRTVLVFNAPPPVGPIVLGPRLGAGALDVDADGSVAAGDALAVINYLNGASSVAEGESSSQTANLDVNGDGTIAASDALAIINFLNEINSLPKGLSVGGAAGGEGEAALGAVDAAAALAAALATPNGEQEFDDDEIAALLAVDAAVHSQRQRR